MEEVIFEKRIEREFIVIKVSYISYKKCVEVAKKKS